MALAVIDTGNQNVTQTYGGQLVNGSATLPAGLRQIYIYNSGANDATIDGVIIPSLGTLNISTAKSFAAKLLVATTTTLDVYAIYD